MAAYKSMKSCFIEMHSFAISKQVAATEVPRNDHFLSVLFSLDNKYIKMSRKSKTKFLDTLKTKKIKLNAL